MKHKFLLIYSWFVRSMLYFFPDIPFIMRFRGWLYGLGMKKCGNNFQITHSAILNGLENIEIGDNVYIANFVNIICNGQVIMKDDILVGPMVMISSGNHIKDKDGKWRGATIDAVLIGSGTWLGSSVCVIGGSIIPKNSIVAANSVVTKNIGKDENSVYAGSPAKIKKR
ncbi:MAG: acyltransferase [Bacteroidales bacterium]|nr:acyltransferase [Bacteroidales bacterium]